MGLNFCNLMAEPLTDKELLLMQEQRKVVSWDEIYCW